MGAVRPRGRSLPRLRRYRSTSQSSAQGAARFHRAVPKAALKPMTRSLTRIIVFIVTILATIGAAAAQQPSTTRPPDPAAAPQRPAAGFKAPDNIDFRAASV